MEKKTRIEAVRCFVGGGVSPVCDDKIKHKVRSAYVIRVEGKMWKTHKMKWRRIDEVAKNFPHDATVSKVECTAAVEAARAIYCFARTGSICFDLDGHLIEDCSTSKTRKRN